MPPPTWADTGPGRFLLEVLRFLPESSATGNLPVLAVTAHNTAEPRLEALAAGVSDVVAAPLQAGELAARIAPHLQHQALQRVLQDLHDAKEAELATARGMQQALLPDAAAIRQIAERHGVAVAGMFRPSAELGGDLWGVWSIDATRVGVFVCDVSGHGTIAAINTFRLHAIVMRDEFDRADPGRFLSCANDRLTGLLPPGQFITMLYAVVDTRHDRVTYASAGCPEPVLAIPGAPVQGLDGSGMPLGIVAGIAYPSRSAPFGPGARLLLHSDALPEARRPDGSRLGEELARRIVAAALEGDGPDAVVAAIASRTGDEAGDRLDDDLTLVCLARPQEHLDSRLPGRAGRGEGRVLVASASPALGPVVQAAAEAAGLRSDTTPDPVSAGRLICSFRYDIFVIDLSTATDETLELLRLIAAAQPGGHLVLLGPEDARTEHLAASLGLEVCAVLPRSADSGRLRTALVSALHHRAIVPNAGSRPRMDIADVEQALAKDEITFGFQPLVSLATGGVVGAEALARWSSSKHGAVPPDVFLDLLGQGKAATGLGDLTVRTALAACSVWRRTAPGMSVAVNLTATTLSDPDFVGLIKDRLDEAWLPPDALVVEIAEREALHCVRQMALLREHGIGVTLDEFGSGDASLWSLQRLPINRLKVSRLIVRLSVTESSASQMLRSMIRAARALDLAVGAVGVETHAVAQELREAGCATAQGWLFGPAMPMNRVEEMLAQHGREPARRPAPVAGTQG